MWAPLLHCSGRMPQCSVTCSSKRNDSYVPINLQHDWSSRTSEFRSKPMSRTAKSHLVIEYLEHGAFRERSGSKALGEFRIRFLSSRRPIVLKINISVIDPALAQFILKRFVVALITAVCPIWQPWVPLLNFVPVPRQINSFLFLEVQIELLNSDCERKWQD